MNDDVPPKVELASQRERDALDEWVAPPGHGSDVELPIARAADARDRARDSCTVDPRAPVQNVISTEPVVLWSWLCGTPSWPERFCPQQRSEPAELSAHWGSRRTASLTRGTSSKR